MVPGGSPGADRARGSSGRRRRTGLAASSALDAREGRRPSRLVRPSRRPEPPRLGWRALAAREVPPTSEGERAGEQPAPAGEQSASAQVLPASAQVVPVPAQAPPVPWRSPRPSVARTPAPTCRLVDRRAPAQRSRCGPCGPGRRPAVGRRRHRAAPDPDRDPLRPQDPASHLWGRDASPRQVRQRPARPPEDGLGRPGASVPVRRLRRASPVRPAASHARSGARSRTVALDGVGAHGCRDGLVGLADLALAAEASSRGQVGAEGTRGPSQPLPADEEDRVDGTLGHRRAAPSARRR